MKHDLIHTALLGVFFLVLFGGAEFLYHKVKLKAEMTRKIVHFGTGLLTLLFPLWISNSWFVLALCSSFLILLLASLKMNLLPSINGVKRKTRGSILFPIIVFGCFLVYQQYDSLVFFYLPILILAICDPIAALVGKKYQLGIYKTFGHTKTLIGSAGFCISAFAVSFIGMSFFMEVTFISNLIFSIVLAVFSSIVEAFSHKGYDNFTIPATVVVLLILFFKL